VIHCELILFYQFVFDLFILGVNWLRNVMLSWKEAVLNIPSV
jgi:hypothetical protein